MRPRTVGEYRQEILAGLERLTNDDLVLLLTCYFPDVDHVQDAKKNRTSILSVPLLVSEIWTRVNLFLATYKLPLLEGDTPPADLWNRSTRTLLAELPSATSASSASGTDGTWSCSEITLPSFALPPAAATIGTTATIPVALPLTESTGPAAPPPGLPRFSWPHFSGLLLIVALIAVHICPYVRYSLPRSTPDLVTRRKLAPPLPPAEPPRVATLALPTPPAPIPAPTPLAPAPARQTLAADPPRPRHHRSQARVGQGFGLLSGPECLIPRMRVVHGQLKEKLTKQKIHLPRELTPGSAAASSWFQTACERAKQALPSRR